MKQHQTAVMTELRLLLPLIPGEIIGVIAYPSELPLDHSVVIIHWSVNVFLRIIFLSCLSETPLKQGAYLTHFLTHKHVT